MKEKETIYEANGAVESEACGKAFYVRKKGKAHVVNDTPCQDYCLTEKLGKDVMVLAVADGHGGEKYVKSDRGSRIACEVLLDIASKAYESGKEYDNDLWLSFFKTDAFKKSYLCTWENTVVKDYESLNEAEMMPGRADIISQYGTTLLFAIVTEKNMILGQLGDGAILMFNGNGQWQIFKRHSMKTSSATSSLASSRGRYAFLTGLFGRGDFGNVLLSTDGIFDRLDRDNSFYLYADSLMRQVRETGYLELPFDLGGKDVSGMTRDDCTVALLLANTPSMGHVMKLPENSGYEKVRFVRAEQNLEIYSAVKDGQKVNVHIVPTAKATSAPEPPHLTSATCLPCADIRALPNGKSLFAYHLPDHAMSLQELMEHETHLEKRYDVNSEDSFEWDPEEKNVYDNQYWMEVLEKLHTLEQELTRYGMTLRTNLAESLYLTEDKSIYLCSHMLLDVDPETPSDSAHTAFAEIYSGFSMLGTISCGELRLPIFRSQNQGQTIPMLHCAESKKSFCRVIYNKEKDIYGLCNYSDRDWKVANTEKVIHPNGVLRLNRDSTFTMDCEDGGYVFGAELIEDTVKYQIHIFPE